jgi:hypothetical protein
MNKYYLKLLKIEEMKESYKELVELLVEFSFK